MDMRGEAEEKKGMIEFPIDKRKGQSRKGE